MSSRFNNVPLEEDTILLEQNEQILEGYSVPFSIVALEWDICA